ncbi:MauE/DoxX family redox-associated membrane protein [Parapedobacter flavus]|uniref:MauE/DoxX family redox-associated membrane protein n=1 Tax=Parapedobacter flavus TaxID=3110225 RepID=UPI003F50FD65
MILVYKYRKYLLFFLHCLIFAVFSYSVFSKASNFDYFINNLEKSPFLSNIDAKTVGILIIIIELFVPFSLFFEKTTYIGYLLSFFLFFIFTGYLLMMFNFSPYLPCSCGGFIEALSWSQHIYFNGAFLVISGGLFFANRFDLKNE